MFKIHKPNQTPKHLAPVSVALKATDMQKLNDLRELVESYDMGSPSRSQLIRACINIAMLTKDVEQDDMFMMLLAAELDADKATFLKRGRR